MQKIIGSDSRQPDNYPQIRKSPSKNWYNYSVKYIKVTCNYCSKNFQRSKNRVNEALKFGWSPYCSAKCQFTARLRGEYKNCQTCTKKLWRTPRELRASQTNRFFCNASCSAIFNNNLRSEALPKNFCRHPDCGKQISRSQFYCSQICGTFSRKRTSESLKKEVLSKIRKFNRINGRIPVKKEMYDAYGKARDVFGTWNKAIEAAGYKPNPVMFSNKYIAKDGHICDSMAEMIIDDWFNSRGISHQRSIPYPEVKKMTCDFVVNKTFIEFFGLAGELKEYDRLAKLKRRLSKKHDLKLIEIKPNHLFPKNKLDDVLGSLI